jgi:Domain of unknown function (DUF4383)
MTLSKSTAGLFGALYALVGLAGFAVTGFGGTGTLVTFNLSVADNIIHLVIGVAGLAAYAVGHAAAQRFCQTAGVVVGLLALLGIVVSNLLGIMPIGGSDVVLHAFTALVLLYVGFAGSPEPRGG